MLIISPYSNKLPDGKPSPKNLSISFWKELLKTIKTKYHYTHIVQVGRSDEIQLPYTDVFIPNLNFKRLKDLTLDCSTFISVDNFFPHFANTFNKKGIVLWGPSDSKIFGYKENINLHGDKQYLREQQYWLWIQCEKINPLAFPKVEQVMQNLSL